jgi:hypothetical protein
MFGRNRKKSLARLGVPFAPPVTVRLRKARAAAVAAGAAPLPCWCDSVPGECPACMFVGYAQWAAAGNGTADEQAAGLAWLAFAGYPVPQ